MTKKMKTVLDGLLDVPIEETDNAEENGQAEEENSTESRYEEEKPSPDSEEVESQEVLAEGLIEQVAQGLEQAAYSERQIEDGRTFLEKYEIDTTGMSPHDVVEKLRKIQNAKEEQAQVLSRGLVLDGLSRLLTFVPEGFRGGFFGTEDVDVQRAKALGWEVFVDEKAKLESSVGGADGVVRLGDQLLMIIPEELYVGSLLAKAERFKTRRETREHQPKQGDDKMGADPLFPIQTL